MTVVAVDIGGSSTRITRFDDSHGMNVRRVSVGNRADLINEVRRIAQRPAAVGIAIAGFVEQEQGRVRLSRAAPSLVGDLGQALCEELECPVAVMNDGEAHVLAAAQMPGVTHGAMGISLGTSVGIGLTDRQGGVMRPCSGRNWDLGEWRLATRATQSEAWWALGSHGLSELERSLGCQRGREQYGYRLGNFLGQVCAVFQPQTVVLSGGITREHWPEFAATMRAEFKQALPNWLEVPTILPSQFAEPGLVGAGITALRLLKST